MARYPMLAMVFVCTAVAHAQSRPAAHMPLNEPIRPLPEKVEFDASKAALGKRLFFDTRLSRDNKVSCASCHDFAKGGADNRVRSQGVEGRFGTFNSPTVFNTGFNFRHIWTGKVVSLEDQIDMTITNPKVFDSSWDAVLAKLSNDEALVRDFRQVYADGLTPKNLTETLALFGRSLVTPSRFDAYLRGDANAISGEEKQGYAKFKSYGCVACHQGINVGGNMFQVFGAMRPYPKKGSGDPEADLGRYQVTRREIDKYVFKVPSLRNVARTAPYFHDGSAQTLEQAVDVMFRYQLGRNAPQEDKALIVKFLNTLNGEVPQHARPEGGK